MAKIILDNTEKHLTLKQHSGALKNIFSIGIISSHDWLVFWHSVFGVPDSVHPIYGLTHVLCA
jgi:hypothetical protein